MGFGIPEDVLMIATSVGEKIKDGVAFADAYLALTSPERVSESPSSIFIDLEREKSH